MTSQPFDVPNVGDGVTVVNPNGSVTLGSEDFRTVFLALLNGESNKHRTIIPIPRTHGAISFKTREEKLVEAAFESCAFKTLMSCVLGVYQFYKF